MAGVDLQEAPRVLRGLYRGIDGFDVPDGAERVVVNRRSSPLYGEIMPTATFRLLEYLDLGKGDVLYDLGSGVGKLVVAAAMHRRLTRVVGLELVRPRHLMAEEALARARAAKVLRTRQVDLLQQDFMRADLSDATVVYSCSTAFPAELMRRLARKLSHLPRGTRFVSLQDLDDNPWWDLEEVVRLDMSWRRRRKVHLYRRR